MKQSTTFAQVATNLLNVLQGYTKGIRFVAILTMLLIVGIGQAWGQYTKASSIAVGDVVVLVYESGKKELSSISGYGVGTSYNGTPAGLYELTVEAGSSSGTFSLKNGSTYLSWSSGNSLATTTSKNANSSWKITFSSGNATILNAKDNSRKLQWNASSPRFACYTSGQTAVQLYKKTASYTVNWTINPAAGGILSATSGNTTTVTPNTAYTYGNPAYTVSPVGKATVSQDGDNFTATPSANCTIQINMVEKTPANISFENMGNPTPITTGYYVGDTYTLPTKNDYTCGDKTFVGWSTKIIENSPTKPTATTYFEPGASVTLEATNTFYAVFAETGGTPTTTWPETDIANISSGDEVVITMTVGLTTYALPNAANTSIAPDGIIVNNIENGCIKGGTDGVNWIISIGSNDYLTFESSSVPGKYLYCTNDNNGVRVGTNANKTFTISGNYLKNTATSRYVGVYTANPDWRCYTSTSTNIGNQTLAFYKKTTTDGYKNYTTKCVQTYKVTFNANGHGTAPTAQNVEENKKATEPTEPSATGYTFDGWYTDQACSDDKKFDFDTPITEDITLYAKWTINQYTVTLNPNYPDGQTGTFIDKNGNSVDKVELKYDYKTASMNLTDLYREIKLEGYQFNDWYSATSGGSKWTSTGIITKNVTLYAQWSKLYTITLYENDTEIKLTPQTSTSYTLPNELSAGSCQDDTKELVGWSTVAIPTPGDMPTSKFYELGETVTLSEDKTTFYAVFATPKTIPGGTEEKEVVTTLDFSNQGYENGEEVTSLTIDDVTVAFNKGTNSNVPKYYNTGTAVRVYGGGYFTVTVPNESSISTIALTFDSGDDESNTITTNSNTYSNGTWTGSAQSVQFTVGGTTGHRRIKSVKVTYTTTVQADDIVTYSNYSTKCVPTCKITYNFDGGEGECTTAIVEEGSEYTLCATAPTRAGHEFLNWKDQNGTEYEAGDKITSVTEDLTLTAQWQVNSYEVTWMSLGSKLSSRNVNYNTQPTQPTTNPTYLCGTDKEFVGWTTQEIDGVGTPANLYTNDFPVVTANVTYHAVFAGRSTEVSITTNTLTITENLGQYKEGTITDEQGAIWNYYAGGSQDKTINLRNNSGEKSYLASPKFAGTVQSITAHVTNGSASARKVYLCSSAVASPSGGDLGVTSIAGNNNSKVTFVIADGKSFDQFYIQVSGALQFKDIVVTSGLVGENYVDYVTSCEEVGSDMDNSTLVNPSVESGIFSVGNGKYVQFSTGNLQYEVGTNTWSFASEQYEVIGGDPYTGSNNTNKGMNVPGYTGKLDLFAWSSDGKFGVNPSNTDDDYGYAATDFVDWSELVDDEEGWYTLTKDEMNNILARTKNGKKLWALATINDLVGLILLPDNWDTNINLVYGYIPEKFVYTKNLLSIAEWQTLEEAGAVFLPAGGSRTGGYGNTDKAGGKSTIDANGHYFHVDNVNIYGYYWLNTQDPRETHKNCASFLILPGWDEGPTVDEEGLDDLSTRPQVWSREKRRGNSVRLVKEVKPDYTREGQGTGVYGTVCYPKNIVWCDGATLYEVAGKEGNKVIFDEVTTPEAGMPYIFIADQETLNFFCGSETASGAGKHNSLQGTFETIQPAEDNILVGNYMLVNNIIKKCGINCGLYANRAYFVATDLESMGTAPAAAPGRRRISLDVTSENTTTSLDNITNGENTTIKVIENGQLIIIRNGDKFNAQGQKL